VFGNQNSTIKEIKMPGLEEKVWSILMEPSHFYLMIGVFSLIMLLKWMNPVNEFLFKKYKFLIAPLNVVLSFIGIFALKLTNAETFGLKIVIALLISAVVTFTYESIGKPLMDGIQKKIENKANTGG